MSAGPHKYGCQAMKNPIVIDPPDFDLEVAWAPCKEAQDRIAQPDGAINFGAAMMADPGVCRCPGCKEYLWRWGRKVRCPDCATEFVLD